jgi:hypothetical protein
MRSVERSVVLAAFIVAGERPATAADISAAGRPAPASEAAIPMVSVVRREAPPRIDGVISDGEWIHAARLELTYQVQPGDNATPSERTEAFVAYDKDHLYLAVHAFDTDPGAIRARVVRRDDVFGDDYLSVYLDTYDDRRRAYVFSFNPLGIQADGLYNEGTAVGRNWDSNVDRTWDGVLESKGALTDDGYVVEAAIPFRTLRFRAGADRRWGLHLQRWIARKAERISWRPISRDRSSLLVQMGSLDGIADVTTGLGLDLIPSVTGFSAAVRGDEDVLASDERADAGLTVAWGITPDVAFSGALNPDFSQVEADVPQLEVNQRFPLFYPEKRPFFLEGSQYFRSPGALTFVNTRQIVDPDWGVKLTGKRGRNSFGVLSAADRAPGLVVPAGAPGAGDDALVGIGRYQRDILANSSIGGFLTTRRFAGESNTVAAVDGQLRLRQSHVIGFQHGRSFTTPDTGESIDGHATYVWYELQARHLRIFVNDQRMSDGYRSDVGFVRRTGFRSNNANIGWEFQAAQPTWWVRVRPFVVPKYLKTTEGFVDESFIDPGFDLLLARDMSFYVYHSFKRDTFLEQSYDYQASYINYTINTLRRLTVDGRLVVGEGVNFDPVRPQIGDFLESRLTVVLKPTAPLRTEFLILTSRLSDPGTGDRLFRQNIYRNRTDLLFTREHGARTIVEYDTLARRISTSLLYSYTPRTNTAVYVGYGDIRLETDVPDDLNRARRWPVDTRTFFVKVTYGFRP